MKLPNSAYTDPPWRIHEIAQDFTVEDVWALPTPGGPDDFPKLVRMVSGGDTSENPSWIARTLFAIRWKLGELLGWDSPDSKVGKRVATLRDRLPDDLREGPAGPTFDRLPFSSVFLTKDEFAAEMSNKTCHAVMHLTWVQDGTGGYRGQMAVLVKPNGLLGRLYMAAILPFRYVFVYPPLLKGIGKEWEAQYADGP
ncbi:MULTISPECIES: DUF2867 domain-containing protein [unclassified Kribbella]|uniref:DUF2867 domain-containing protein n=1 Tax=unclassified Kribbella TaxID=2644121 RepID=UPI00301A4CEF